MSHSCKYFLGEAVARKVDENGPGSQGATQLPFSISKLTMSS